MGLTTAGINKIGTLLTSGCYIGLGNLVGTTFTEIKDPTASQQVRMNYERVQGTKASFQITDGVIKNSSAFYFKDADDGVSPDTLTPQQSGGWGTINALAIYGSATGSDLKYAGLLTSPVTVYQGVRVKFDAEAIQLTIMEA